MYHLQNILPFPLKEQKFTHVSNIWQTDCFFEKGKKYLVLAPSGKGKSTFLHILYGLRKDYEGRVSFDKENIQKFQPSEWANLRKDKLAIVFQDLRLFPNLSAIDNIRLKAQLTNHTANIEKMAARLGIQDLLQQSCETLSYGQKQRVAIIRALVQPFDFLLLDEPFSHLDEENTKNALSLITEICQEQEAGMILVSLGEEYPIEFDKHLQL